MGAWSSSLYGNDTTLDVKDAYTSFLEKQLSNEEAYEKLLESMGEMIGTDEEPLFWYALAETQWKCGRLTPEVKEKALGWIDKKGGIEPWLDNDGKGTGWLKTLDKLREKLETPQRKEKRFRKKIFPYQNPWNINDVYAYRIHGECLKYHNLCGKYILIQKRS